MNLSIFDNDGTLGLENARAVVLRGTTTVSQLFSPNFFPIDSWLRTALESNGFDVVAVRSSPANWFGYATNIEIEINVYNTFTSEQARVNAIRAIEAYTANFGLNKVFSNTTLSVAYDAYVAPVSGVSSSTNPRPAPSGTPSIYDQSNAPAGGDSGFLNNLGLGLGVSTPVVIAGGALVLLLILRR